LDHAASSVILFFSLHAGEQDEGRVMIRRNAGTVVVAGALVALLLLALILARAQGHLPELGLDLTEHLFGIVLAVFVFERMLAWREERRWLAAKNWLYMILLETIDDLLKELLPPSVPRRVSALEEGTQITLYELTGERIHFGEAVAYTPLELKVGVDEKDLQSYILWYAQEEVGAPRYADLARSALSDAREQVRDVFGSSARLMDAEITAMLISFEQAALAAIRHLDSASSLRDRKLKEGSYLDGDDSGDGGGREQKAEHHQQRVREADQELAFVCSIIVESVVNLAMKPKGWLEREMYIREGHSPFGRLQSSGNRGVGIGSKK
jgi:hypothetical protein